MRTRWKILLLGLSYLLLTAKSCDNGEEWARSREQAAVQSARDSISRFYRADSLDPSECKAFELSAMLKLRDLNDYLKIMGDSATAREFRKKAEGMALSLLYPGEKVPISLRMVRFDSIRVSQPLERKSDSLYSGELTFSRESQTRKEKEKQQISSAGIKVVRQKQVFGSDTVTAWKVFLGEFH
jgi:hypothetical protein